MGTTIPPFIIEEIGNDALTQDTDLAIILEAPANYEFITDYTSLTDFSIVASTGSPVPDIEADLSDHFSADKKYFGFVIQGKDAAAVEAVTISNLQVRLATSTIANESINVYSGLPDNTIKAVGTTTNVDINTAHPISLSPLVAHEVNFSVTGDNCTGIGHQLASNESNANWTFEFFAGTGTGTSANYSSVSGALGASVNSYTTTSVGEITNGDNVYMQITYENGGNTCIHESEPIVPVFSTDYIVTLSATGNETEFCSDESTNITATPAGADNYLFTYATTTDESDVNGDGVLELSPISSSIGDVTVKVQLNGCEVSETISLEVDEDFSISSFTPNSATTICEGNAQTFTTTLSRAGTFSYSYTRSIGGAISDTDPSITLDDLNNGETVSVAVTSENGHCSASTTSGVITTEAAKSLVFTSTPTAVSDEIYLCEKVDLSFNARIDESTPYTDLDLAIYRRPSGGNIDGSDDVLIGAVASDIEEIDRSLLIADYADGDQVLAILTDNSSGGCTVSSTPIDISVFANTETISIISDVSGSGGAYDHCTGTDVTFTANAGSLDPMDGTGYNIKIFHEAVQIANLDDDDEVTSSVVSSFTNDDEVYALLTTPEGCEVTSSVITVTNISAVNTVTLTSSPTDDGGILEYCTGGGSFTATVTPAAVGTDLQITIYQDDGDNPVEAVGSSSNNTLNVTRNIADFEAERIDPEQLKYFAILNDNNGCETTSNEIIVQPFVSPNTITLSSNPAAVADNIDYCTGTTIDLTATIDDVTPANIGLVELWIYGNNGSEQELATNEDNTTLVASDISLDGYTSIFARAQDENGCLITSDAISITSTETKNLTVISDHPISGNEFSVCQGDEVEFTIYPSNFDAYVMNITSPNGASDYTEISASNNTFNYTFDADVDPITLQVLGTDNSCGAISETITVDVLSSVEIDYSGPRSFTNNSDNVLLSNSGTNTTVTCNTLDCGSDVSLEFSGEGVFTSNSLQYFGPSGWSNSSNTETTNVLLTATTIENCESELSIEMSISPEVKFLKKSNIKGTTIEDIPDRICGSDESFYVILQFDTSSGPFPQIIKDTSFTSSGTQEIKDIPLVTVDPSSALVSSEFIENTNATSNNHKYILLLNPANASSTGITVSADYSATSEGGGLITKRTEEISIVPTDAEIYGLEEIYCSSDLDSVHFSGFPTGGEFSLFLNGTTDISSDVDEEAKFNFNTQKDSVSFYGGDLTPSSQWYIFGSGTPVSTYYTAEYDLGTYQGCNRIVRQNFVLLPDDTFFPRSFELRIDGVKDSVSCGADSVSLFDNGIHYDSGFFGPGNPYESYPVSFDVDWNYPNGDNVLYEYPSGPNQQLSDIDTHYYAEPGTYIVNVVAQIELTFLEQCGTIWQDTIVIGGPPHADIEIKRNCAGQGTIFNNVSTLEGPEGTIDSLVAFNWEFTNNSVDPPAQSVSSDESPDVDLEQGVTDVFLEITSLAGCKDTLEESVVVFPFTKLADHIDSNRYEETFDANVEGWYSSEFLGEGKNNSWTWQNGLSSLGINDPNEQAWVTNDLSLDGSYYDTLEVSYVQTPCFDLRSLTKPMLSFDYWVDSEESIDGMVLQYILSNKTTLLDNESWVTVGDISEGVNWYNSASVLADPGGQQGVEGADDARGWSGESEGWINARISLNTVKDSMIAKDADYIHFRLAFASNEDNSNEETYGGVAFDDFVIERQNRLLLSEQFWNASGDTNTLAIDTKNNIDTFNLDLKELTEGAYNYITYHISKPEHNELSQYNFYDVSARSLLYGVEIKNRAVLDGVEFEEAGINEIPTGYTSEWLQSKYNTRSLQASDFEFITTHDFNTIDNETDISVVVEKSNDVSITEPLVGYTIVYREEQEYNGEIYHNVVKSVLPNGGGQILDDNLNIKGGQNTLTNTWTRTEDDNTTYIAVSFVQGMYSKEIYQVSQADTLQNLPDAIDNNSKSNLLNTEESLKFSIAPNPVETDLTLTCDQEIEVQLLDVAGNVLDVLTLTANEVHYIDMSLYAAGMYFVVAQNDMYSHTYKVMKK